MPLKIWREFIRLEASGGIILLISAVLAIIINNSPWHPNYQTILNFPISFHLGSFMIAKPLLYWINDGLMTLFFLLIGLEIKREIFVGELNSVKKATLPVIAAIGGMLVPALIYFFINWHHVSALRGWAIPTATDIAFSLGVLALLGSRIPRALKVFLTALAIIDDIGAIIIIAVFYTENISGILLLVAILLCVLLLILNRLRVRQIAVYLLIGFLLWFCVLKSGVHATLAGIVLAFAIPLQGKNENNLGPLRRLELHLHPWVIFGVLPIFAFCNAGVQLTGLTWSMLFNSVTMGIAAGLFIGKQVGILATAFAAVHFKLAHLPKAMHFRNLYGVAVLGGIGFTMSLFIGDLAFGQHRPEYMELVRLGVILGSLLSGILGYTVLLFRY